MIKEMAIDLLWLALLLSAIGFNLAIVTTVVLIVMNIYAYLLIQLTIFLLVKIFV